MVIGIYAREDIKAKTDEHICKQIEDCKEDAYKMYKTEDLKFVVYEDRHHGVCKSLMGLDALKRDVDDNKIDVLFTYTMGTLLASGIDMISFLSVLKQKGINVYYSLLCKKW